MKSNKIKITRESILYFLGALACFFMVYNSIDEGDFLLKATNVIEKESPRYFWTLIVITGLIGIASVIWFIKSLFESNDSNDS